MRQKRDSKGRSAEQAVEDIRRATRRRYSAEEKIRIVLEGLRSEYLLMNALAGRLAHFQGFPAVRTKAS